MLTQRGFPRTRRRLVAAPIDDNRLVQPRNTVTIGVTATTDSTSEWREVGAHVSRGTTPVQAALMGRKPIGNDINPLSVLLTRPRLAPPPHREVARRLDQI